jgi:predicted HTH domain antitoxin
MAFETITFEVSSDLLSALNMEPEELSRNIRLIAAMQYFQDKRLSLGKAAQLAGMNRLAFMDVLAERGIVVFDYDESMVASELKGVVALCDPIE